MAKTNTTGIQALAVLADTLSSGYATASNIKLQELEILESRRDQEYSDLRQLFFANKQRQDAWADTLAKQGYIAELDKTPGGQELIGSTTQEMEGFNQTIEGNINKLLQLQATITEGKEYGKRLTGRFMETIPVVEGAKEEAWKDFLITGNLDEEAITDKEGNITGYQLTGTDEWGEILKGDELKPDERARLLDDNYRKAVMSGLRTVEDAQLLQKQSQDMALANVQMDAANFSLNQGNIEAARKTHDEIEKQIADMYKNMGLSILGRFALPSDAGKWSLSNMMAIDDPEDLLDIKNQFSRQYPEIAGATEEFINMISLSKTAGVDLNQPVVRFMAKAYKDFLTLREYEGLISQEAEKWDISFDQAITRLGGGDKLVKNYNKYKNRAAGFRALGLYEADDAVLEQTYALVEAHNKQQLDRLNLDLTKAENIAVSGYNFELPKPGDTGYISEEDYREAQISLAMFNSFDDSKDIEGIEDVSIALGERATVKAAMDSLSAANRGDKQEYTQQMGNLWRSDQWWVERQITDMQEKGFFEETGDILTHAGMRHSVVWPQKAMDEMQKRLMGYVRKISTKSDVEFGPLSFGKGPKHAERFLGDWGKVLESYRTLAPGQEAYREKELEYNRILDELLSK